MLLCLLFLVLLTPLHTLQSTNVDKKNSTGNNDPKSSITLKLSKPLTTVLSAKLTKQNSTTTTKSTTLSLSPKATTLSSSTKATTPSSSTKATTPSSSTKATTPSTSTKATTPSSSTKAAIPSSSSKATTLLSSTKLNTLLSSTKPTTVFSSTKATTPLCSTKPNTLLSNTKPTIPLPSTKATTLLSSTKPPSASSQKISKDLKDDSSLTKHPIQVLISEGCSQKDTPSGTANVNQEKELELKPGSPLVMTHRISLIPGSCTGSCETEMAALRGRVERLEKEMSNLKDKCGGCSHEPCPQSCEDHGRCEKGKCLCLQGFSGPDCSKCTSGSNCTKGSAKIVKTVVETMNLKVSPEGNATKGNMSAKLHKIVYHKTKEEKEKKKQSEGKEGDKKIQTKVTKANLSKSSAKLGNKTNTISQPKIKLLTPSNGTKSGMGQIKVGQAFLKHSGAKKPEEALKGKITESKQGSKKPSKSEPKLKEDRENEFISKALIKSDKLKDQPILLNITHISRKKTNGTSKGRIYLVKDTATPTNKTHLEKHTLEQSTLAEKNGTHISGKKTTKAVNIFIGNVSTTKEVKNSETSGNSSTVAIEKGSTVTTKSQYIVNVTISLHQAAKTKPSPRQSQTGQRVDHNHQTDRNSTKKHGGLGSVRVQNITSHGFVMTWRAPQAMFQNFTVTRREYREGFKDEEVEAKEGLDERHVASDKERITSNITDIQKPSETTNKTSSLNKPQISTASQTEGKNAKKYLVVLHGTARSLQFSNLRPQTHYSVSIFGTGPGLRSKIHRVKTITGPEPPTELLFNNVTESSLNVSWSKPKARVTGFKVKYADSLNEDSGSIWVDTEQSYTVISKLSSGSSYEVSVTSILDLSESDPVTAHITTVPATPTHFQAINITDTKALLKWKPTLAKVDRYVISYESARTPNVTVTVMVSGTASEHQLRGLQRSTFYTVKALSQKDSLESEVITTTFTTASGGKAGEVTAHSAVILWKEPYLTFKSYKLTYKTTGAESKEVSLNPTMTQYKLTGLLAQAKYTVLVQGERDGKYTTVFSTEFTTGKLRFPFPADCSRVFLNGFHQSGEVDTFPGGRLGKPLRVYCDMETDGGGWTVFQRRMNGKTLFYRSWKDYNKGFGNLSEEFWLGNDYLHNLTSMAPVSLRVDLRAGNESAYAHYAIFSVDTESRHYALNVSGYTGTAGDSMSYHNGRPFSTKDKDPSPFGIHCARAYMGGWWYKNCYKANLNGVYGINTKNQGVVWIDWKGKDSSIPFTEMKFRPSSFTPKTKG